MEIRKCSANLPNGGFKRVFALYDHILSTSGDCDIVMKLALCAEARHFLNLEGDALHQACDEIYENWCGRDIGDMVQMVQEYADERGCAV